MNTFRSYNYINKVIFSQNKKNNTTRVLGIILIQLKSFKIYMSLEDDILIVLEELGLGHNFGDI